MSKRSFRSLAVVAGAALAIGSMAPAMAARVNTVEAADVEIETFDVNDITNVLPLDGLGLGTTLVAGIAAQLTGTVFAAPNLLLPTVGNVLGGTLCIPSAVLGAAVGLNVGAIAGVGVGLGGVNLGLLGGAGLPLALVGGVTGCALDLVGNVVETVADVQDAAAPLVATAVGTAGIALGVATSLPGTVIGLPTSLLTSGALDSILSISASGNANVVAALLGSF